MIERVGIIGVGHLAGYLVEGLRRADERIEISLSPRNAERARSLAARFGARVADSNQAVADRADLVILATRPGDAAAACRAIAFRPGLTLVSVAAGLPLEALRPAAAPADLSRAMPLSCAAIGRSPTLLYPDQPAARALFGLLGPVHALPDEEIFTRASVIAAFYGWIYALLAETVAWATEAGVPPRTARSLVLETVRGAAEMGLARPEGDLTEFLETLATPGGITEQGLRVLWRRNGLAAWTEALQAVLEKMDRPG